MLKDSVESVTLATILNGEPIDVDTLNYKKRYRLTNKAKGLFIINKSKDSPIYFINAKSFNKNLSKQLAEAIIERCNIIVRDIQSKDLELKQKYIDIRLSEISMELTKAEEKLKAFREKNISIISSP